MIPWFQFTVIRLGPIPIQVWGSFVALGMAVSIWIISRRSKRMGENAEQIIDLALWAIIGGLIFARVFHVFLYEPAYYLSHPIEMIKVWHGGLSSFGGLFGAVMGFIIKMKKTAANKRPANWLKISDILAYAAIYGWMIGRIGCLMIHDHPGRVCDSFLSIRWYDGKPRLDMALLEILALIPLAILFFVKRDKQSPSPFRACPEPVEGSRGRGEVQSGPVASNGWFTSILFIYYGIVRFILDFFRATDIHGSDARYLGLTPAQYFAILLVVWGGCLLVKRQRVAQVLRPKNNA